jgi:prepilin-type N-terminal cleavage/methylation domain-containing protein
VRKLKKRSGFTLVEVMVAVAIMAFCLTGLLLTFLQLLTLTDLSRDFTNAASGMQATVEAIRTGGFDCIYTSERPGVGPYCTGCSYTQCFYHNDTFEVAGFDNSGSTRTGMGVVEISDVTVNGTTYSDVLKVRTVFSFYSRGFWDSDAGTSTGRLIGEDRDLDGVLDTGIPSEDADGNARMDSPIETVIYVKDFTNSTN